MFTLQKKSSKRISPFHAVQISDNSGAFSVWPNITPEKSLHCGVMMGHWPNFLPWYWPNFTPNYGVMMSPWIFSVLFELIIVNWNPFQRWFSEVAPVSWHINFISRSYGWGVRARFVIFGCSLSHLTICHNFISFFILKTTIECPEEIFKKLIKCNYLFDKSWEYFS